MSHLKVLEHFIGVSQIYLFGSKIEGKNQGSTVLFTKISNRHGINVLIIRNFLQTLSYPSKTFAGHNY